LAGEGAANRASQEKLTNAQLAVSERLGKLQSETSRYGVDKSSETQIKLSNDQIKAQEQDTIKRLNSAEGIAAADRAAAAPLVTTTTGQSGTLQGGIFKPTLDANGKPVNILTKDNENSADAKTMQYLLNLGVSEEEAKTLVFKNKNADPMVMGTSIFNNIMDVSRKNMGNPTPDDITNQVTAAIGHTRRALKSMGVDPDGWNPATTGTEPATKPAAPSSATDPGTTVPADTAAPAPAATLTPSQKQAVIAAAKAAVKPIANGGRGLSRAAVLETLQKQGITAAEAGL
jgi:hypothetical protein